jgi:hypothetical protein
MNGGKKGWWKDDEERNAVGLLELLEWMAGSHS